MAQLNQNIQRESLFQVPLALVKQAEEQRAYPRFQLNVSAAFRNGTG